MYSEIKELFGYNLRRIRKAQNLSQIQLTEKVNMAFTFISDIENGKKWVSPETIDKLSMALDVEVYQFFLPKDYNFSDNKTIKAYTQEIFEAIRKIESRY